MSDSSESIDVDQMPSPDASPDADTIRVPTVRRGTVPAVLLVGDPFVEHDHGRSGAGALGFLTDHLAERLHDLGVASIRPSMAPSFFQRETDQLETDPVDEAVDRIRLARERLLAQRNVDSSRLTEIAIGLGAAVLATASSDDAPPHRVALIAPIAVELAARRIDRGGAERTPRERAILALAALEPMRRLSNVHAESLVLHPAAARGVPVEWSLAWAGALTFGLEGTARRCVLEHVAFADAHFTDPMIRAALVNRLVELIRA